MSEQKQLAIMPTKATQLLTASVEDEVKETARKLMRLTPGGNRLTADQATDLAVYALLTGLNPFNNECYHMEKVGPVPGIAGYRVKAQAYLNYSSPRAGARLWEEYRQAEKGEADFDPAKGDVAWVCTLHDSLSHDRWQNDVIKLAMAYRQMGATFQEAREAAIKDAGECPSWSAVGVVHADEHFSGNAWRNNVKVEGEYKPEMWDRNERAKKRAAKGCYRKGFPTVNIPDREDGDIIDLEFSEIKAKIAGELASEIKPVHTEAQIMSELGFEPDKSAPQTEAVESAPEPTASKMSLETESPTSDPTQAGLPPRRGNAGPTAFWKRADELKKSGKCTHDQCTAVVQAHMDDWPGALQALEATYGA